MLYGTLSTVIHGYSSAEFSVNSQNYVSTEAKLLKALSLDEAKIKEGVVEWADEKKKFIW